ncbi:TonB-dependent receptor domain-containing protein [Bacteroides sp. CACC 737]|uniref:TonB-dependent receptor domain-containing protein n=1 Tax=Bacteroides sp. CACC 737 TaxID=2755405 RepID=UPI00210224B5|nr:TonB-dependent receptor [Bacteroides sp. CACC 737]
MKNFKFTANYSYDFTNSSQTVFYTPLIGDGQSFGGRGYKGSYNTTTTNFNQILAYSNVFGDNHHLSAKIGHEYYKYEYQYLAGQKTNFFNPNNPELDTVDKCNTSIATRQTITSRVISVWQTTTIAINITFLPLSVADGTSRFLDRWGNFWSVGAAWRISNEAFMEGTNSWLNDLKLRASYVPRVMKASFRNMTMPMCTRLNQDQYTVTWNGSELGYSPEFYGNPDLTWEKQKTFDVGVDFRLFDRGIRFNSNIFIRRTDDMLFKRPVAFSTAGRPYNWENLGAMKNTGIEFEVNVDIFNQSDLKWTVSLVGSHYKKPYCDITRRKP